MLPYSYFLLKLTKIFRSKHAIYALLTIAAFYVPIEICVYF
jgi:hypothetical protein